LLHLIGDLFEKHLYVHETPYQLSQWVSLSFKSL